MRGSPLYLQIQAHHPVIDIKVEANGDWFVG